MGYTKQISYNTLGNVTTLFCQWLIIMLIPKMTDFSEAGIFAVAVSVASILNQIATFTLNQYQVADQNTRFSENDFAVARVATILISFVSIIPLALLFGYDLNQTLIIFAYTAYRNFINYGYLHAASLQLAERLDYVGKCMIGEGMVSFIVFMAVYILSDNLFLATLLMAVVGGTAYLLLLGKGYRSCFGRNYGLNLGDRGNLGLLLKIGFPLMLSTLAPIIITALPKLILEDSWGTETVGYFSTLTSPTIIVPTLALAVFTPFMVMFSNICRAGDMGALRRNYSKLLLALTVLGIIGYVVSVLLAGPVFTLIYGESISEYVDYFNILMVGIFLYSAGICGLMVLVTKDQGRYASASSLAALAISVVIFLIWIPESGLSGATWGLMAAYGAFGLIVSLCVYLVPLKKMA